MKLTALIATTGTFACAQASWVLGPWMDTCGAHGTAMVSCDCDAGYEGELCNVNTDDCLNVNCGNGTCVDGIASFKCECNAGFEGEFCDVIIDHCLNANCGNGTCVNGETSFTCECDEGWSGESCNERVGILVDLMHHGVTWKNYQFQKVVRSYPIRGASDWTNGQQQIIEYKLEDWMINAGANGFLIQFNDLELASKEYQDWGTTRVRCVDYLRFEWTGSLPGYMISWYVKPKALSATYANHVDFFDKYICGEYGGHTEGVNSISGINNKFRLEGVKSFKIVYSYYTHRRGFDFDIYWTSN